MGLIGRLESIEIDLEKALNDEWQLNLVINCYSMDEKTIPVGKKRIRGMDMGKLMVEAAQYISEMENYVNQLYGKEKKESANQVDAHVER